MPAPEKPPKTDPGPGPAPPAPSPSPDPVEKVKDREKANKPPKDETATGTPAETRVPRNFLFLQGAFGFKVSKKP